MIRAFPTCGLTRYFSASFFEGDHRAYDIYGAEGAPVYAVESGVITRANQTETDVAGFLVRLRADSGRTYIYSHLAEPGLPEGRRVRAGQRIGILGQTGNAPSPHIHFQALDGRGFALEVFDELKAVERPRGARTQTEEGDRVACPGAGLVWLALFASAGYFGWRVWRRRRRR